MEKGFNNLKIASIINFILAALFYTIFPKYSFVLVAFGLITLYLISFDINQLNKAKGLIMFVGIILIFINFISAVFTLIGYDCIQTYIKENKSLLNKEEAINKDVKRIDILLKLGVGMVVLSGVLFATTTWDVISSFQKLILLLLLGTLFLALSIFSEKKLKIKKTAYMYWLLGCSFYVFTWIAVCHFEYFGTLFSYKGPLSDLAYLTTYLISTILLFITSKKFNLKRLLSLVYLGNYLIIYYFLNYISLNYMIIMLVITAINLICNLCIKKETNNSLLKISKLVSYSLVLPILSNYNQSSEILTFITACLNIINLGFISYKNDDFIDNLLIPIMTYIYVYVGVFSLDFTNYSNLLFATIFSIISIFIKFTKSYKKAYIVTNQIIYTIGILFLYFNSFGNELELLLVNIVYLVTNQITSINKENRKKRNLAYNLQPIPITLLVLSICEIIDIHFIKVSLITSFSLISVMYGLMFTIAKNEHKEMYKVLLLLSIILNMFINYLNPELIPSIIIVLGSIYLFIRNYLNKSQDSSVSVLSYIILLLSIYYTSTIIGTKMMIDYHEIISPLITILSYIILLLVFRKKRPYKIITNIALIVPMYSLIEGYISNYYLNLVLENIVQFYILYLLVKYICKNKSSKNLLTLLGIIYILIQVIFVESIYIGIYVGIVGVIVIILGYLDNSHKSLFNVGIIITIVNILYQLHNLWKTIPFWLYLLIVGLGLIGFVTYKETKKIDNKKDN